MCGLIFIQQKYNSVHENGFLSVLERQSWRGPDNTSACQFYDGRVYLGHNRLSILDPTPRANQPLISACGNYVIIYNGEIYNHLQIRKDFGIDCKTKSDTETLLETYVKVGADFLSFIDGMFAFVIYNIKENSWFCARDQFGIKPLYFYEDQTRVVIASEAPSIAELTKSAVDPESIEEWRAFRRPVPGRSFFLNIQEVLPATCRDSRDTIFCSYWQEQKSPEQFDQNKFESLLEQSVKAHEIADVKLVSFLSGGIDSAVIASLSNSVDTYSIGLEHNNEFEGATETAKLLRKNHVNLAFTYDELRDAWRELAIKKGEPPFVPNEGLIYLACNKLGKDAKVILTGEGADELLFGYDRLASWAMYNSSDLRNFVDFYRYDAPSKKIPERFYDYALKLSCDKLNIHFLEDFFLKFHLPGLLRRMDSSTMAASKEARVPFVSRALWSYMYRREFELKIRNGQAKFPLRIMAEKLGLIGPLRRKKIGFTAVPLDNFSRLDHYNDFQNSVMEALHWS